MEDEVQEIKSRIDLVAIIGQSVKLVRRGQAYVGLCPFHAEKTPSFYVYPSGRTLGGHYHCFGCSAKGDPFTFIQQRDNIDFPSAKKVLAQMTGVKLRSVDPRREARRARLYGVMEAAGRYFRAQLAAHPEALAYVRSRGVTDESIERFELGYHAAAGGVLAAVRAVGYSVDEVLDAGVIGRNDRGTVYENFRERLIFPVRDDAGKLVTFGGRLLRAAREGAHDPKYINGRATEIFEKSAVLYGLHQGRSGMAKERAAVVVEGYMDVLVCQQAGFAGVVAPMGVAITPQHAQKLHRYADTIVLALDPDAAGERGMERGMEIIRSSLLELVGAEAKLSVSIKILTLPGGRDPDEIVIDDPERWRALVASARPVIDHLMAKHAVLDRGDPRAKRRAADEILPFLRVLSEPIAVKHYRDRVKHLLDIDDAVLDRLLGGAVAASGDPARAADPAVVAPERPAAIARPSPIELRILHALLAHPQAYRALRAEHAVPELRDRDLLHPGVRAVLSRALENEEPRPDLLSACGLLGEEDVALLEAVYATALPTGRRSFGELIFAARRSALRRERELAAAALDDALARDDELASSIADGEVQRIGTDLAKIERAIAAFADRPDAAL